VTKLSIDVATGATVASIESESNVTVLRGRSGAGKTVLAKSLVLSREEAANNIISGTARIGDSMFELGRKPRSTRISYIPESIIDCFLCSKVSDEILISLLFASPGANLTEASPGSLLACTPLRAKSAARIGELSGGQLLLLAIETAVLAAPDLILIDASLDCLDRLSLDHIQSRLNHYLQARPKGLVLVLSRNLVALPLMADVGFQAFPELGILSRSEDAENVLRSTPALGRMRVASGALVEFKRLTGGYRSEGLWTVRSFDFQIMYGRCVGITGSNGSGKSTLLKLMSGSVSIESGDVFLSGHSLRTDVWPGRNGGVAYFSQDGAGSVLFSEIEAASARDSPRSLPNATNLSSGESFLVAVAEAMKVRPALWLFDEPTGHVQSTEFAWVLSIIRHAAVDAGVIVVSHNLDLLEQVCDERYELVQCDSTCLVSLT